MHRIFLTGASLPAKILYNLTKNLTAHLAHKLCAVLPKIIIKKFTEKTDTALAFFGVMWYNIIKSIILKGISVQSSP